MESTFHHKKSRKETLESLQYKLTLSEMKNKQYKAQLELHNILIPNEVHNIRIKHLRRFFNKNNKLHAVRIWRLNTRIRKFIAQQERRNSLVYHFNLWKKEYNQQKNNLLLQKAEKHFNKIVFHRTINTWKNVNTQQKYTKQIIQKYNKQIIQKVFSKWNKQKNLIKTQRDYKIKLDKAIKHNNIHTLSKMHKGWFLYVQKMKKIREMNRKAIEFKRRSIYKNNFSNLVICSL
eukprot:UN28760